MNKILLLLFLWLTTHFVWAQTTCTGNVPIQNLANGMNYTITTAGPLDTVYITVTVVDNPAGLVGFLGGPGNPISFPNAAGTFTYNLTGQADPYVLNMFFNWAAGGQGSSTAVSCGSGVAPPPSSPTTNAPEPTCPSEDVISIYSSAYTNIATNYNPNWGQTGFCCVNPNFDPGTGNLVLAYPNFNYQGTNLTPTNASAMEYLHVDVWTNANPANTTLRVSPINFGTGAMEVLVTIPYTSGEWSTVVLPKSAFTGMTWNDIRQLKFEAFGTRPVDIYLDNIYFSTCGLASDYCNTEVRHLGASAPAEAPSAIRLSIGNSGPNSITVEIESATASPVDLLLIDGPAGGAAISETIVVAPGKLRRILRWATLPVDVTFNVLWSKADFGGNWLLNQVNVPFIAVCPTIPTVPIAPTTAPPLLPTCPSDQVISLFSNSYSNVPVNTFLTGWSAAPVTLTNLQIAGTDVKYYQNVTFLGIETTGANLVDASEMTTLHIDFWSANATQFRIKLVDLGPDGTFAAPNPEWELTFNNPTLGEWVSYEIPLSQFTGLTSRAHLAQYILSGMPNGAVDFYITNLYFSNCALPEGWSGDEGVNCDNGSSFSYNPTPNVFTGTSTNCYYANPFNSDGLAFAQYELCGNGSITAQVTSISGSLAWAGVIMRENNAPGAKKAQLMTNFSNFSRREFRTTTNGLALPQQFPSQNRYWLRITRTGNQFVMHISPNNLNWFFAGAQNIAMNSCIQVGLVITNYNANSTATATFANVSVTGGVTRPTVTDIGNTSEAVINISDFSITPNPTTGEIQVDLSAYGNKLVQMELYNLQGKILQSVNIESNGPENVDLSTYSNGMYFIRVRSEGFPDVTKRVVLNNRY